MPEAKNNFLSGRMNKDLDKRLLSNSEYIDARNISTTSSETGNSGSVENVLGTEALSNFNISGVNLETIGKYEDIENRRIYMFVTNYTDSSPDTLSNFAAAASSHYILSYDLRTRESTVLVSGRFLNFSKTHRIIHVNLIEGLLFWTDNRNQPRKINVETALSNLNQDESDFYYSKEEHISVAKYYPYNSPRLYEFNSTGRINDYNHSLKDRISEIFDTAILGASTTYTVNIPSGSTPESSVDPPAGSGAVMDLITDAVGNIIDIIVTDGGSGFNVGDQITFVDPTGLTTDEMKVILRQEDFWIEPTMKDTTSLELPYHVELTANAWGTSSSGTMIRTTTHTDPEKMIGCIIYVKDNNGQITVPISQGVTVVSAPNSGGNSYNVTLSDIVTIASTDTIYFGANPYYNEDDIDTISNIRERFVRFAYRFRYDDNEYSLISPFTQTIFIPRQAGHFKGDSDDIERDEKATVESSNVSFFENSVTEVELVIDLPEDISNVSELVSDLKVKEVDIIYKDAGEQSIKVVKTINENDLIVNNGTTLNYTYKSTRPIKTLAERDLVRVSDKVPVLAQAQESVSNRIVYGNFLTTYPSPDSLDFSASYGEKGYQGDFNDAFSRREYPSHSLKKNRTYQAAIVLSDKFGRKSEPIISDDSTAFSRYDEDGFTMIDSEDVFMGEALRVTFNESIPEESGNPLYKGIYDKDTNPMGWYSYQIVVKQKEQSYYNIYAPTILNGYPKTATSPDADTAHLTLVGDNINKVPRDFESASNIDGVFRSNVQLYPRVISTSENSSEHDAELFLGNRSPNKVSLIGLRDDLGLDETEDGFAYTESPFFSIPTVSGKGSNPLIARISTRDLIGAEGGANSISGRVSSSIYSLNVLETRPVESNLELFWETSSSGLISDINADILAPSNSAGVPFSIKDYNFFLDENSQNNDIVTSEFYPVDFSGNDILNSTTTAKIISVRNKRLFFSSFSKKFAIEKNPDNNKFFLRYREKPREYYKENSWRANNYDIVVEFSNTVNGNVLKRRILIKDNALSNIAPSFNEDGTNLGLITATDALGNANGKSVTKWREISDINVSNGSRWTGLNGLSLKQLSYRIDRLEWQCSENSQWYDYWYEKELVNKVVYTRDASRLIDFIFVDNPVYEMKMMVSPLVQWGWSDRLPAQRFYGGTFSAYKIDDQYDGETINVYKNYEDRKSWIRPTNPTILGKSILSNGVDMGLEFLGNTNRVSSLEDAYKEANYTIPSNGLSDTNRSGLGGIFTSIQSLGYYRSFKNHSGATSFLGNVPFRVTFTLFDANENGISTQFTAMFDIQRNLNY